MALSGENLKIFSRNNTIDIFNFSKYMFIHNFAFQENN